MNLRPIGTSRASGWGKVPDAKTLARIAQALGGEVIARLHERLVALAQVAGRKKKVQYRGVTMRVDTTVVETNIHYPNDSSLLGDGARVLTRTMKRIEQRSQGKLKRKVRNRLRSVNKRVRAIAIASREKGAGGERTAQATVSRATASVAPDAQRCKASDKGGGAATGKKKTSPAVARREADGHGRSGAASGEAGKGAGVRRDYAAAGQDS